MNTPATHTRDPLTGSHPTAPRTDGLSVACFAMSVLLLVEYGLGIEANVFVTLPRQDHGKTLGSAIQAAISNGPAAVAIHAALGLFLILTAAFILIRAAQTRRPGVIALSAIGLAALVIAAYTGTQFIDNGQNGATAGMAMAWALALLSYLTTLFIFSLRAPPARQRATGR